MNMAGDAMADGPTDEQLACRAQQGCRASFEELARRWQVPLLGFLRRTATLEDAEDLVQTTLVRAYQNLHRYRPQQRFAPWLLTIARRLSVNHWRQRRPRAATGLLESLPDRNPTPGQMAAENEQRRRLWDLAKRVLSERQVTATWLYYVEDLSVEEIARVLGCTRTSVKVMLFRARKRLLPWLEEQEPSRRPRPTVARCPSAGE